MEEIEVKILNIDRKKVVERLILLGVKKIFEGEIQAYFFDLFVIQESLCFLYRK